MATLKNVGAVPNTASAVAHKGYVDTTYNTLKVDEVYVASAASAQTANMVTPSYVAAQDALRASKTAVTAADALYIPITQMGAPNGVATIGSDGYVPSSQLPTVTTDRVPTTVNGNILFSGSREVLTTSTKEFQAGSLLVPDPGYPYQILAFANIWGAASQAPPPPDNRTGVGNYGKAVILGPSDKIFAEGVSSGNYFRDFVRVVPYASLNETPTTRTGTTQLDLWLSLWPGSVNSTYTFYSQFISFFALVLPAF